MIEPGPDGRAGQARLGEAIAGLARRLAEAGIEGPAREARLLAGAALGLAPAALLAAASEPLAAGQMAALEALARRRLAREPLSRIRGEREFWGRRFEISPATLDPRPDTETLVEVALALAAREAGRRPLRVLELGLGSGAALVSLLAELPGATGLGVDLSLPALAVARRNLARHLPGRPVALVCGDWARSLAGPFDLLIANPPYVASGEIALLEEEVRGHDPHLALDGGPDGLDAYRRILPDLPRILPAGWLALEVGAGQAPAVAGLLAAGGEGWRLGELATHRDLAGRERVVSGRMRLFT